jgi:hypothetical protein
LARGKKFHGHPKKKLVGVKYSTAIKDKTWVGEKRFHGHPKKLG